MKHGLDPIAILQITTLRGALGATHWYAKVICGDKEEEVKVKLSRADAKYLNDTDGFRGHSSVFRYRAGELSERISSKEAAIEAGIALFQKSFAPLGAKYLVKGRAWVSHPQPIVAHRGDQTIVDEVNRLAQEAKDIGGYEGNPTRMASIYKKFRVLERRMEAGE